MSDAAALPVDAVAAERPTSVRWGVVLLTGVWALVMYMHRSSLANASTTIEAELQLTDSDMGWIKAAFSFGYLLQFLGSALNSRFSNRFVLGGMALASSAALVGVSLSRSMSGLWLGMACIGLAQAGVIPCVGQVVRDWIPANRRATAGSIFTGCMSVGSAITSGITGILLERDVSWRTIFAAYAGVGVLWAIGFVWWFRDRARDHFQVNAAERELIEADSRQAAVPRANLAVWLAMLGCRSQLFNCLQQFFRNFAFIFFITWYPAFLQNAYGVSKQEAGLMNMVPLLMTFTGIIVGGQVIDALQNRTGNRYLSRSVTTAIGHSSCGLAIFCSAWATDPWLNACLIGVGMMFFGVGSPATWAATMDISGKYTTLFFALMNGGGVLGGILSPITVGRMTQRIKVEGGDWNQVLYLFAVINVFAAISWLCINSKYPAKLPAEADGPRPVGTAGA